MYVRCVEQYDTPYGCCCSCHTSTAPVVVFYVLYEYEYAYYHTPYGCCCSCHTSTAPVVVFRVFYEYEYAYYLCTIITYQVCESSVVRSMPLCVYSAVRTAAALLLLLLLLLFVMVHLPPEVFFMQQQYLSSNFIPSCTNERSLLLKYNPWQNSRFCSASALPIIVSYLSSPTRACAKPQAYVSPPRRSPPCIMRILCRFDGSWCGDVVMW